MTRREFITLLGSAAAAWPLAVRAQQSSMPTVGILYGGTSDDFAYLLPSFRRGLRESGYIESRNVAIDYRWAENRYDRVPTLAEELVQRQVDVIVAIGGGGYVAKIAKATSRPSRLCSPRTSTRCNPDSSPALTNRAAMLPV